MTNLSHVSWNCWINNVRIQPHKYLAFPFFEWQTFPTWVENIELNTELWWIMGKLKMPGWNSMLRLGKIGITCLVSTDCLTRWYRLSWWFDLFTNTPCEGKPWEDLVSKDSNFVRFRPHTLRTHSAISAAPYGR